VAQRKDRRARSRKRRAQGSRGPAGGPPRTGASEGDGGASEGDGGAFREAVREAKATPSRRARSAPAKPERPRPAWHPLPLAEILIVAGTVAFFIGVRRGTAVAAGRTPLLVGVAAVSMGTLEFTLREHRSGFRSHTTLLAVLPVVAFHTVAVLVISAFTHVGQTINLTIVAVDVVIFGLLFRLLRAGYLEARYAQTSGRGPRRAG
jgi:hypothetical protein